MITALLSILDAVISTDGNGVITRMNGRAEKLTGYSKNDGIGRSAGEIFRVIDTRTGQSIPDPVDEVLRRNGRVERDDHVTIITRNGSRRHITFICEAIRDGNRAIAGTVLVFHDVTDATETRDRLQRLAVAVDQSIDGIAVADMDGRITFVNPAWARMHGYSPEELVGENLAVFHSTEQLESDVRPFNDQVVRFGSHEGEVGHIRKDGTLFMTWMTTTLMTDETGTPIGMVGTARDITLRKKIQSDLEQMQKLRSIGTLAGGIAHDFNNILQGIFGNISLAKKTMSPDDPARAYLDHAEIAIDRAVGLSNQLLTFAVGGEPIRELFDAGELCTDVAEFNLAGSRVRLVCRKKPGLWPVMADKAQIQQVLANMIINARQAMPRGGPMTVKIENVVFDGSPMPVTKAGRYVAVTVRDEGEGIPPEYLPRIFEPYFSTKDTGSGLGLAIAYFIVKRHGGDITVESEPGKGSVFTIYLPAAEDGCIPGPPVPMGEMESPAELPGARVLLMDDDVMVREVAEEMLISCGFDVTVTPDSQQTVAAYEGALGSGRPFDVVILDLTIPGGPGGLETVRKLRVLDPALRAIVSSGYANDAVMSRHAEHGFHGIIRKPYNLGDLRETVTRVLTT